MIYHPGVHAVTQLLASSPGAIQWVAVVGKKHDKLVEKARALGIDVRCVDETQMYHWVPEAQHQGICAKAEVRPLDQALSTLVKMRGRDVFLLILDQVQDPHNLGACLRSACAMGVDAVILPERRACGLTATVVKVACGATAYVPVYTVKNLVRTIKELQDLGVWCVGTSEHATQPLSKVDCRGPLALVYGNEQSGLRHLTLEQCDVLATIPTPGPIPSLNVSVAVGVGLYHCLLQRQ